MWREQIESCLVTRRDKFVVDEQLCFNKFCHLV
jgi:hypothetical protein